MMSLDYFKNKKIARKFKAFSLVEFIIILFIFTILAGVSIFNYKDFQSSISIVNVAHDIAISMRQMQIYGISAIGEIGTDTGGGHGAFAIRGLYLNLDGDMILFKDDGDRVFDNDTLIDRRSFPGSIELKAMCLGSNDDIINCIETKKLHITFTRPFPDAYIINEREQNPPSAYARIDIGDSSGTYNKSIEIWSSGAIAVINTPL